REKLAQDLHSASVAFVLEIPKSCPHPVPLSLAALAGIPGWDQPELEKKPRGLRPESSFNPMRLNCLKFYASARCGRNQALGSVISVSKWTGVSCSGSRLE